MLPGLDLFLLVFCLATVCVCACKQGYPLWISPSAMWVLGIKLKSSSLASTFTHLAILISPHFKIEVVETSGVTQQVRTLTMFSEDPGLVPRTHMAAYSHLMPIPEAPTPPDLLLAQHKWYTDMHVCRDVHAEKTPTHI